MSGLLRVRHLSKIFCMYELFLAKMEICTIISLVLQLGKFRAEQLVRPSHTVSKCMVVVKIRVYAWN